MGLTPHGLACLVSCHLYRVCMCARACGDQRSALGSVPQMLSTCIIFHWPRTPQVLRLGSQQTQAWPVPASPVLQLREHTTPPSFFIHVLGTKSGPLHLRSEHFPY